MSRAAMIDVCPGGVPLFSVLTVVLSCPPRLESVARVAEETEDAVSSEDVV